MLAVKQVRFNSFKSVLLADHKSMPFYLFVFLLLSGLLGKCLVQAQTDSSTGDDSKGDGEEIPPPPKQLTCDFGSGQELNSCNFDFLNATSHPNIRWKLGTGQTAFWLGGPLKDRTTMENTGGYLYLDTSFKLVNKIFSSAALETGERSPIQINGNDHHPPSPAYSAKFNSSNFGRFSTYNQHYNQANNQHFNQANNQPYNQANNQLHNQANNQPYSQQPNSRSNRLSQQVYEKKFMQELWHSNNIPNSKTYPNSIFNSTLQHANSGNQTTIPFNVVSNVLNGNLQQRVSPNRTNERYYKEPLVAVVDVLQTHSDPEVPNSAFILSPNISATGPMGNCVRFYYNMDGLSCEKLKVLVHDLESAENLTLWETAKQTDGDWVKVEISYAHDKLHKLIFDGMTKPFDSPERAYRGYVGIDDFSYAFLGDDTTQAGMCHGHCTFEGGLCGWTNLAEEDDFDWSQGRGSDSLYTGPSRDYYSFSKELPLGGYLYIDASYPRRPGDKALLRSPQFPAPTVSSDKNGDLEKQENNGPLCFRFAVHMFGNGIGTLRVKVRSAEEGGGAADAGGGEEAGKNDKILWEHSGEAGNNWYLAQLTYASTTPYHFIFEGVVGPNYLGNIAIDNIVIEQGACPIMPQTASRKSGDCTFEESMCAWTNANNALGFDHFDWSRQFSHGVYGPKTDHTRVSTNGYFMSLNGNSLQRGGSYAWLISPHMQNSKQANSVGKCMSFYYFMYQRAIEPGGPSLGGLRIQVRTIDAQGDVVLLPVWRLNNHQSMRWMHGQILIPNTLFATPADAIYQVVIEGVWGDARVGSIAVDDLSFYDVSEDSTLCKAIPENAVSVPGECSFDRSLCGWKNDTLNMDGKGANRKSDSLNDGKSQLIPHKISVTSGGVSGLIGVPQSSSPLNLNNAHLFSRASMKSMVSWRLATSNSRPNNLQDRSFRAPVGYVYFDVFNQAYMQQPMLRSPKFAAMTNDEGPKSRCLSFWFSAFGRGDNSILSVYLMKLEESGESGDSGSTASPSTDKKDDAAGGDEKSEASNKQLLWTIQSRLLETRRNLWYYAQTTINGETDHHVIFQGEATDGGFALDDITFYNGTCTTRPPEAAVKPKTDESSS